jgi:hypothetical protein
MKYLIAILTLYFWWSIPVQATTYFVRTDGGTSVQCTGTTDAAYPGSGTGQPCAFSTIPAAVTPSVCGDFIKLKTGQTFDVSSAVVLTNKSCSVTAITITSTGYSVVLGTRVATGDAASMAKVRMTNASGQGAFVDVAGGSYWRIQGIEVTDNVAVATSAYIMDLRNGGKTDVIGCLIHPKETNPTWERPVFRGIGYEGSAGLLVQDSRIYGFLGYAPGTTTLNATMSISSTGGKFVTIRNNFISTWYSHLFTGGAGGAGMNPDQTATFSGTPTLSSATFSNTTGLTPGQIIRIDWLGTGTKSGTSFTQTSGTTLTNADVVHGGTDDVAGVGVLFPDSGYTLQLVEITAGNWQFMPGDINNIPSGDQPFVLWQAVQVDSIVGSTVNYTPYGASPLTRAPTASTRAGWITDGVGHNAAHWTVEFNEFWIDPAFAHMQQQLAGQIPKGIFEWKHMIDATINGNRFTGYPAYIFLPSYSNGGSTPWSTQKDVTISNNFFDFDTGYAAGTANVIQVNLKDPYHSNTLGKNILIFNNLARHTQGFMSGASGDNVQVYHNTIINDVVGGISFNSTFTWDNPTTNWVVRDNIVSHRDYGAQCFFGGNTRNDCWPSGTWSKNVVVDANGVGVTTSFWGAGSILGPVPTSFSAVGFTNAASGNYRLSGSSPYKAMGTGGSDPGIDQDALEAALAGGTSSPTTTICKWSTSPPCVSN